jgi:phospholipid/cholesterol/gamma-HCH transport system substrate-binding protein
MRRNQRRGMTPFAAGALVLGVIVVLTYLGFAKAIPFRHHYTIHAAFRSANNIKKNAAVRIAGVNVGKVTKVRFLHAGEPGAVVSMRIDKKGLPIHKDATVSIRPRIFLEGNFFVDLHPGSPSAPVIDDGDTIDIQQTTTPVQLDQILTALQSDTRQDLKRLLRELSTGLAERGGAGFNRSIPYWEPAYRDTAIVNDALHGSEPHDLSGYIKNAGAVAEALDQNSVQLQSLITDFNTTARAFAVKDTQLASAIGELPKTLRVGRSSLAALNDAFPAVRRLAADFRPGVRSSGPAIDATLPLARELNLLVSRKELRGLVADLRPTVPALARLNNATVPLLEQVRPASSCQNQVIIPWSLDKIEDRTFPAIGPVYQEQVKPLGGLAGESRSGDPNGQWFRVLLSGGIYAYPAGLDRFMLTTNPIEGANPPKPAGRSPYKPEVPCETQQPPDLRTVPAVVQDGHKIQIPNTPAAKARYAKAQKTALEWVERKLKSEGLSKLFKVADKPLEKAQIPKLRQLGKLKGARR